MVEQEPTEENPDNADLKKITEVKDVEKEVDHTAIEITKAEKAVDHTVPEVNKAEKEDGSSYSKGHWGCQWPHTVIKVI